MFTILQLFTLCFLVSNSDFNAWSYDPTDFSWMNRRGDETEEEYDNRITEVAKDIIHRKPPEVIIPQPRSSAWRRMRNHWQRDH